MNKDRYESLPDDLKEIIDRNSGRDFAAQIGDVFNNVEEVGKKMINDGKGQVVQLTPEEKATFDDASASVVDRWIEEAKSNGIDGAALVEKAKAAVLAHTEQ